MNVVAIILAVLSGIEKILPLLTGQDSKTTNAISGIIGILSKLLPLIEQAASSVYASVKNIINALSDNPSTTEEQLAALKDLDTKVDAAFEAAAVLVDPDVSSGTNPEA